MDPWMADWRCTAVAVLRAKGHLTRLCSHPLLCCSLCRENAQRVCAAGQVCHRTLPSGAGHHGSDSRVVRQPSRKMRVWQRLQVGNLCRTLDIFCTPQEDDTSCLSAMPHAHNVQNMHPALPPLCRVVADACLLKAQCSVKAADEVFKGDPCRSVKKRLFFQWR